MAELSDTNNQTARNTGESGSGTVHRDSVLVTGTSGFVGGYILHELVTTGYRPVCLVRDPDKLACRLTDRVRAESALVPGDLFDMNSLKLAAQRCRAAVHLVGIIFERPRLGQTFERIHVEGTRNVVEACAAAGVQRYVHMSALGTRPGAVSRYHQTKWLAEQIVRDAGLQWTIFRPSLIHGPEGEFMRMMKFFCTSRLRTPVMPYFGRGTSLVQPVSVRDVATCFVRCLSMPEAVNRVYELGGPERFTWKQFYNGCSRAIAGRRRLKVPVPVFVAKLLARTIVPLVPSFMMPHKFNVAQVQMSQEDSVCDTDAVERDFGLALRDFRGELSSYAGRIP